MKGIKMAKKISNKKTVQTDETVKDDIQNNKSFQIVMNEKVHRLLKERAQQQQMPIGEFIQNLLASLEQRLEKYKEEYGFGGNIRSDKIDARLIKFLMIKDMNFYTHEEIKLKLEQIKEEFKHSRYRPKITFENEE